MQKKPLIGVSICAVVLVVLASLTNVVGYQTVQSSNQKIKNNEVNQKELLFQTILDIADNKEIQKVILGSEIAGKSFFDSGMRFLVFNHPVLTEKFLKRLYTIGVILSKTISKSKIHSMIKEYKVSNQGMQKEINVVIEKDASLKNEMTQLSSFSCGCEDENSLAWHYPVYCTFLLILAILTDFAIDPYVNPLAWILGAIVYSIAEQIHCYWYN